MKNKKELDTTLYLVTDSSYHTEKTFLRTVEEALRGGVTLVQLREKERTAREYLDLARKVKEITDRYQVPLLIDDRVDVAGTGRLWNLLLPRTAALTPHIPDWTHRR